MSAVDGGGFLGLALALFLSLFERLVLPARVPTTRWKSSWPGGRLRGPTGSRSGPPLFRGRRIGVSGVLPDRIMDLMMHNQIGPAVNQIEVHLFQQQVDTQRFLLENGVQVEAWAPLAEG